MGDDIAPPQQLGVTVDLLGPALISGSSEHAPRGRPQLTLLALLSLQPNRPIPVDQLVEWIWGDRLPDYPRAALHTRASRLRHDLGPYARCIESDLGAYQLTVEPEAVTTHRFTQLASTVDQRGDDELATALSWWRGQPFHGTTASMVIDDELLRLQRLRESLWRNLVARQLDNGHTEHALETAEQALHAAPFDEHMMQVWLTIATKLGHHEAARERFQRWSESFQNTVGSPPLIELDIPPRPTRHPIPETVTERRMALLAEIDLVGATAAGVLANQQPACLLIGPAGSGKSTIAAHWCEHQIADGLEMALIGIEQDGDPFEPFLGPDSSWRSSPLLAPDQYARHRTQAVLAQVQAHAAEHPLGIIIDDLHLATDADAELVEQLVIGATDRCRILVTSRPFIDGVTPARVVSNLLALPHVLHAPAGFFDLDDLHQLTAGRFPDWPASERLRFSERLFSLTRGHPLATDAILRRSAGLDMAAAIARLSEDHHRDIVGHIVTQLDATDRAIATVLALIDTPLPIQEIAAAVEQPHHIVGDRLQRLTSEGIVRGSPIGTWVLSHSLFSPALTSIADVDTLASRLAKTADRQHDSRRSIRMRSWTTSIDAQRYAADVTQELRRLMASHQHLSAVRLGDLAHQNVFSRRDERGLAGNLEMIEAWVLTARAYEFLGNRDQSDFYADLALDAAIEAHCSELVVQATDAVTLGRSRRRDPPQRRLELANAWIDKHGSDDERVRLRWDLIERCNSANRPVDRDDVEAIAAIAARTGDDGHRAAAGMSQFWLRRSDPNIAESCHGLVEEVRQLAARAGDIQVELTAQHAAIELYLRGGQLQTAARAVAAYQTRVQLLRWPRQIWFAICARAVIAAHTGQRGEFDGLVTQSLELGQRYPLVDAAGIAVSHQIMAEIHGWDPVPADIDVSLFDDVIDDPIVTASMAWIIRHTEPDQSRAMLLTAIEVLTANDRLPLGRGAWATIAYSAYALEATELAAPVIQALTPFSGEIATIGVANSAIGPVDAALALAYELNDQPGKATKYRAAVERWAATHDARPWLRGSPPVFGRQAPTRSKS